MNVNGLTSVMRIVAGCLLLWPLVPVSGAQSTPPTPLQAPAPLSTAGRASQPLLPADDLAGLKLTSEQRAQIREIEQNMKSRMDLVIKDGKLAADQKGAMLRGLEAMKSGEIYKILTAEQREEVRKRVMARREAARRELEQRHFEPAAPQ